MKKIDLTAVPEAYELNEVLLQNVEKLRRLSAFCEHDLKAMMGVIQTALSLFTEENPRPQSEAEELLHQSLNVMKSAFHKLNSSLDENSSPHQFVWIVSDKLNFDFKMILDERYCLIPVLGPHQLQNKLLEYRPHAVLLDSRMKVKVWSDYLKSIGSHLMRVYMLGELEGTPLAALKRWNIVETLPLSDDADVCVRSLLSHLKSA